MIRKHLIPGREILAASLLLFAAMPAFAARALVLNAYDAEGLSLGGADIATTSNTASLNSNPAGLAQVSGQAFDGCLYPYYALFRHTDSLGNNANIDQPLGAVLAGSYAQRLSVLPDVVAAAGLFVQGGSGFSYDSLENQFGKRDVLSSSLAVLKFVTGFGWNVTPQLNLGAALGISYARGNQKFFPNTSDFSDPLHPFAGVRFDGGQALTPNVQLGVQYHLTSELTLAAAYIGKIPLPLAGGTLTVDYDGIGQGRVKYKDARIDGFALPQEVDIGLAYRVQPRWLVTVEVNWLDYSGALSSSHLHASNPGNSAVPATIDAVTPLNFHDQYVFAMGTAYTLNDTTVVRGGFNVENNPVPDSTESPVLNFGQKREMTFGFCHKFAGTWAFDFAFEYQPPMFQAYHNAELPLGDNTKEKYGDVSAMFAISRRW